MLYPSFLNGVILHPRLPPIVATSLQWPLLSIFKQTTLKNLGRIIFNTHITAYQRQFQKLFQSKLCTLMHANVFLQCFGYHPQIRNSKLFNSSGADTL